MALLAFLLPVLLGLAACLLLASDTGQVWTVVWMAPGVGISISSVLYFGWSLIFYPRFQPGLYLALEVMLLAALAVAIWWRRRRASSRRRDGNLLRKFSRGRDGSRGHGSSFGHAEMGAPKPRLRLSLFSGLMGCALLVTLVFFVYRAAAFTVANPNGVWDAWSIWNARARFLLLGDARTWRNVFAADVYHADYPFLLSGFIGRCWVLMGRERLFVPAITGGLFGLSTLGLLSAVVARFRGLTAGLLAGTVLASSYTFIWITANQYADGPLAFFILATLALVALAITAARPVPWLVAAGCMAACATWTKNEGNSFQVAALACLVVLELAVRRVQPGGVRRLLGFIAGMLPVTLLYLGFRFWLAPPTDLFDHRQMADVLREALDPARYAMIGQSVWNLLKSWGAWKIPLFPALAGYLLLGGLAPLPRAQKHAVAWITATLALTFLQYLSIFVITPHDLAWHLATALSRLTGQLVPGGVLLVFLLARGLPGEGEAAAAPQ